MAPSSPKPSSSSTTEQAKRKRSQKDRRRDRRLKNSGSGESTPKDDNAKGNEVSNATSTFTASDDFIPFTFSDPSDNEAGPSTSTKMNNRDMKGKGKEVDTRNYDKDSQDARNRDAQRGGTIPTEPRSSRSERSTRDPPRGPRNSGREWDRGKERDGRDDDRSNDKGGKRKYEQYDDGYENKKQRMDAASRKCPWVGGLNLESSSNVAEMLHREVEAFVDWISPTPAEDEIRGLIVTQISRVIVGAFPDATVYPFGSYATKLYLPLGDIDLVVLSDAMAYSDKATVLHYLANMLKRHGITSHVTIIAKAKVPIVKFVTTHGRFKVDISLNQENGLVSGKIILGFLKDMIPREDGRESKALRSLVMITKAFLSQRSMNEVFTGGLGSYSIVCLAVSFLQMHPKIRRGEIDPEQNLGVLVMEFFELYGLHFNYDEVGISLRDGGTYFNKRQRGWQAEYKRNMLSIEDPADPSNDISSGSYHFHKVRTAFAGCHTILTSTAYLRARILSARRSGVSVTLRGIYEPEDLSILSTVMGITQETMNHRKLVQELYDKRVLHNILGIAPLPIYVHDTSGDNHERSGRQGASSIRNGQAAPGSSKASRAVEEVWQDADKSRDHDDFDDYYRRPADDEGGRYDIGRQPPKKRRRTGKEMDERTVYVIDDDEDEEDELPSNGTEGSGSMDMGDDESVQEIERPDHFQERPSRPDSAKRDSRRSYWLAKGVGIEGGGVADDTA